MDGASAGIIIGVIVAVLVILIVITVVVILYRKYSLNKPPHVDRRTSVNTIRIPNTQNNVSVSVISPPSYSPAIPSDLNPPPYSRVAKQIPVHRNRDSNSTVSCEDNSVIFGGYGYSGECNEAFDRSMDSISDMPSMDDILMTSSKTSIPAAVALSSSSKNGTRNQKFNVNSNKNQIVNYNSNPTMTSKSKVNKNYHDDGVHYRIQDQSRSNKNLQINKYKMEPQNSNIKHESTTSGDSGAETGGLQCCSSPDMCPDSLGEIKSFPTRPSRTSQVQTTTSLRSSSGDSGVEAGGRQHLHSSGTRDHKMNWVVVSSIETDV